MRDALGERGGARCGARVHGLKLVLDVAVDDALHCYALMYHFDAARLKAVSDALAAKVEYRQAFSAWKHVLPRTVVSWVMMTNLVTRWLSPESAWDL